MNLLEDESWFLLSFFECFFLFLYIYIFSFSLLLRDRICSNVIKKKGPSAATTTTTHYSLSLSQILLKSFKPPSKARVKGFIRVYVRVRASSLGSEATVKGLYSSNFLDNI